MAWRRTLRTALPILIAAPILGFPAPPGWVELGGSATGGGISQTPEASWTPSIAFGPDGHPAVAWVEFDDTRPVRVNRWNGAQWVDLTGGLNGPVENHISPSPCLKSDAAGNLYAAWCGGGLFTAEVYLKKWNGQAWVELGGSATGGGVSQSGGSGATSPSLALDSKGRPVVAWNSASAWGAPGQVLLRAWSGEAWVEIGGSASPNGISAGLSGGFAPSVAIDEAGNPWVAWEDGFFLFGKVGNIYLRRWNGQAWVEVGGSATGSGLSAADAWGSSPSLVLDPQEGPVVAWGERASVDGIVTCRVQVKRWNGAKWTGLAPDPDGATVSTWNDWVYPHLAIAPWGLVTVTWSQAGEVYLKACPVQGAQEWIGIGGSGSGDGISATPEASTKPAVALSSLGVLCVVWEETVAGAGEIHLRRTGISQGVALGHLKQLVAIGDGGEEFTGPLPPGSKVLLGGTVFSGASPTGTLEVELRQTGGPYLGVATHTRKDVSWGAEDMVKVESLSPGQYRWRARAVTPEGAASPWLPFGANPEEEADFVILSGHPPGTSPPPSGGDGGDGGACAGRAAERGLLAALIGCLAVAACRRSPASGR